MSEERKLQFHGGIGMSLIPVAIYVFFCMVLFIGFKAFNMEALAVGGFLALLIGGISVSYTHLDVYKRQQQKRAHKPGRLFLALFFHRFFHVL